MTSLTMDSPSPYNKVINSLKFCHLDNSDYQGCSINVVVFITGYQSSSLVSFSFDKLITDHSPRMKRGTVRVKCLAQEHNTMFPARA